MTDTQTLNVRRSGDAAVIEAPAYVNQDGGELIRDTVVALNEEGVDRIVLDLSACSMANSVGISFLIEVLEACRQGEGRFAFCCVSKTIAKTLQIMGLLQTATLHEHEDEAVATVQA